MLSLLHLMILMELKGINVRHLGRVRNHVKQSYWRRILLLEMIGKCNTVSLLNHSIARVCKVQHRRLMRQKMKELKQPGTDSYIIFVVQLLNLVFGQSEKSEEYWRNDLLKVMILIHTWANINRW